MRSRRAVYADVPIGNNWISDAELHVRAHNIFW